jgi:hypothetical protein
MFAVLSLVLLTIIVFGGLRAGVSASVIVFRAFVVMGGVFVFGRILIRVIATFEEI